MFLFDLFLNRWKVSSAFCTLRDNSRLGFMVGFVTLVRLSLAGEARQAKTARQFIPIFSDAKYKTKTSQVYLQSNLCGRTSVFKDNSTKKSV